MCIDMPFDKLIFFDFVLNRIEFGYCRNLRVHCVLEVLLKSYHQTDQAIEVAARAVMTSSCLANLTVTD